MDFFPEGRELDFVALGRAGLDLYAAEQQTDFNDVLSFRKFVGGSPANTTAMLARLGRATGLITKVSDDPIGRFVISYLQSIGTDTSQVRFDTSGGRTSLVITEMRPDKHGAVFYRNRASDQLITPGEIEENYIARAAALIVSGVSFSESPGREAAFAAIEYARRAGTKVVLDLDYRPNSWDSPYETAIYLGMAAEKADILCGDRSEYAALNWLLFPDAENNPGESVLPWLERGCALALYKQGGERGAVAYAGDGERYAGPLYRVPAVKPFGAGDAYLGTVLHVLMRCWDIPAAMDKGAAAASIVIARESCSAASPTEEEIETFIVEYQGEKDA